MMKLVVYTNNAHKLTEISSIMKDLSCEVLSYRKLFDVIEIVEDGLTLEENALKKVMGLPQKEDVIYLADDSGLEVKALNGAPGVLSARYAGEEASGFELCQKIISNMEGIQDRSACFRTALACRFPDGVCEVVEGVVDGRILMAMSGDQGFGYDPVFCPNGYNDSFAQMSVIQKNQISHRFLALQQAKVLLRSFLAKPLKKR